MRAPPVDLPPCPERPAVRPRPSVGTGCPAGCPHALTGGPEQGSNDLRCACGSLLGRFVETGLEMKCRRCKRCVVTHSEERPRASRGASSGVIPRIIGDQIRCSCGSLLAKTDAQLLWLRCRHCKRDERVGACPGARRVQARMAPPEAT